MRKVMFILPVMMGLAACATVDVGSTVTLDTSKAFLTADTAFLSVQQTVYAGCSLPTAEGTDPCNKAIDILHTGAQAEQAGYLAEQAGSTTDLTTAVTALTNIPAQLVALGVLKAK